jgi:hypothetical protein
MRENWRANCLQQRFAIALEEWSLEMQAKTYIETQYLSVKEM